MRAAGRLSRRLHSRQQKRDKQANDREHYQQLDERHPRVQNGAL
jgi:hypothetical protein